MIIIHEKFCKVQLISLQLLFYEWKRAAPNRIFYHEQTPSGGNSWYSQYTGLLTACCIYNVFYTLI